MTTPWTWASAMTTSRFDEAIRSRWQIGFIACLCIILAGCSKTLITSKSPNGSITVRVHETSFFPDCSVDVTARSGWFGYTTIAERSDCIVNFAHVAWSPDSRTAAIYVDDRLCSISAKVTISRPVPACRFPVLLTWCANRYFVNTI